MFSPYYHWSGRADPENHCAVNVALYGPGVGRWTMTERSRRHLHRDATTLAIGPSALHWDGDSLLIDVHETAVPWPRKVQGRIRVTPVALATRSYTLDTAGRHHWMPLAPTARVELAFKAPDMRWSGHGYCDTNAGSEPIQDGFRAWTWSRTALPTGTAVLYDTVETSGARRSVAVAYDTAGEAHDFEPPPRVRLPGTRWMLPRDTQADAGAQPRVRRTLEDTPFYARSEIATRLLGHDAVAVHESLSGSRIDTGVVRLMLPFRMPRRSW